MPTLFMYSKKVRAGEMAQSVKYLSHRCEDLISDSKYLCLGWVQCGHL